MYFFLSTTAIDALANAPYKSLQKKELSGDSLDSSLYLIQYIWLITHLDIKVNNVISRTITLYS
jgi:hypothetical protein